MSEHSTSPLRGVVVEEELRFTLLELSQACRVDAAQLTVLVHEGVIEPEQGNEPHAWQFSGPSLQRARAALRLSRDLELGAAGTALVLDLLDEIDDLKARLRRVGLG